MADKLAPAAGAGPFQAMLGPLGPALIGMQTGSVIGAMAQTVLGQFDAPLPPAPGTGTFLVVPNLEGFAAEHGLDPRQVRLWAAVRETAFQALTGVSWFGPHLASALAGFVATLEMRPEQMQERLEALQDPSRLEEMLTEPGGLSGLTPGPGHLDALESLQALLAVLDGYGEWITDRSAADLLPDADRIRHAVADRRDDPSPAEHALDQAVGLRLERSLSGTGSRFCDEVARRWGDEALGRLWEGPETIPTRPELDDALGWAARVLLT
jgi:putative hydrolase